MYKFIIAADTEAHDEEPLYREVEWPTIPRVGEWVSVRGLDMTLVKSVYHCTAGTKPHVEIQVIVDEREYNELRGFGWKTWPEMQ